MNVNGPAWSRQLRSPGTWQGLRRWFPGPLGWPDTSNQRNWYPIAYPIASFSELVNVASAVRSSAVLKRSTSSLIQSISAGEFAIEGS